LPKQSPVPTELNKPFWDAANEDRLVVQRCNACTDRRGLNVLQHPPATTCGWCGKGEDIVWHQVSGRGVIQTIGELHDAAQRSLQADQPLNMAVISLDDAGQPPCYMLSHLRESPIGQAKVGDLVEVIFEVTPATGQKVPEWRVVT
jgi:uncharacterized OB-fold protein